MSILNAMNAHSQSPVPSIPCSVTLPARKREPFASRIAGVILLALLSPGLIRAQTATWTGNPTTEFWNTPANWSGGTVPNSPTAQAVFNTSPLTALWFTASVEVDSLIFNSGGTTFGLYAPASPGLTISGAGVVNNSGRPQYFITTGLGINAPGTVTFTNSASAGTQTVFENYDSGYGPGATHFRDSSTAGSATIYNNSGNTIFHDHATAASATVLNRNGSILFQGNSTAGSATITSNAVIGGGTASGATFSDFASAGNAVFTNHGARYAYAAASTSFSGSSSAANGTFINEGGSATNTNGARTSFSGNATAGNATLIAYGGTDGGQGAVISFEQDSTGGTARVQLFGNSSMVVSNHNAPGLSIGSIEGDGTIYLGSATLTVGTNNLSTVFSGKLTEENGGMANLVKVGTGTLILSGTNVFHGSTTVAGGTLIVGRPSSGMSLGSGPVTVSNGGNLAGDTSINGATTVESGGHLSPGYPVGTLTFNAALTLASGSAFDFSLGTTSGRIDVVGGLTGPTGTGGLTLNLSNSGGFAPGVTYTLFSFTTAQSFDVTDFTFGRLIGNTVPADYSLSLMPGALQLTYNGSISAIPEPATYVLFAGAAALGGAFWRRRRSRA